MRVCRFVGKCGEKWGTVFLGTYQHNIDTKGRLFIPIKLREGNRDKKGKFIVTRGLESCLYLYEPAWFRDVLISKLGSIPVKNQQDARAFKRMLLAGAQEVELDPMGRILVPRPLSDYSGLKKEVSILGVGERIELWATPKWNVYTKKAASTFQKMGRELEV